MRRQPPRRLGQSLRRAGCQSQRALVSCMRWFGSRDSTRFGSHPERNHLARPAGGPLISGDEQAEWCFCGRQWLLVDPIRQQDTASPQSGIQVGKAQDHAIPIGRLDNDSEAETAAPKRVRADADQLQQARQRHAGIELARLIVELHAHRIPRQGSPVDGVQNEPSIGRLDYQRVACLGSGWAGETREHQEVA